ncbi:MAG: hypothetical protein KBC35_00560 [Candidatus Pacebacteria bacterium]|nr:hypothetical protein [Candidatus Paceibacterota bacterium]
MHTIPEEEGWPVSILETYLAMIEGSVGSRQYLRLYVDDKNEGCPRDVIDNGRFPCAYFSSSVMYLMTLLEKGPHTTVVKTVEWMLRSQWYQVYQLVIGAVITWGPKLGSDGKHHKHIGFYVGDEMAISTDGVTGIPTKHHFTYGVENGRPVRKVEAIFFHEKLRY